MSGLLALAFAAALSAGNAEFEEAVRAGAADVALQRLARETLARPAIAEGVLKEAMLASSAACAKRADAERICRGIYAEQVESAYRTEARKILERMRRPAERDALAPETLKKILDDRFPAAFVRERAAACAEQAKGIAGAVRPSETEFEAKDDAALRREMTAKVAAQQKHAVFEENLKYISEAIIDPVVADARREMQRQRDCLLRMKCEAYAPSALARELEAGLRKNVADRKVKTDDPAKAWNVFPGVLKKGVDEAVARRTLERITRCADDVPIAVDAETLAAEIAKDPKAHRRSSDSEKAFRARFAQNVLDGALARAETEAPAGERAEFAAYVRGHAGDPAVEKAIAARIRRELLPALWKARAELAQADLVRGWPQLADGTWYPEAALADDVAARSDYAKAVAGWRKRAELAGLLLAGAKGVRLEETDKLADKAVAEAFARARNAIAAQNAILTSAEPEILREARERKASFWRATPDYGKIVELLTEAVEDKWDDTRVETLWPEGEKRPANASRQHAALFPSVRKRIELIAKSILAELEKPKSEEIPEEESFTYAISVLRKDDSVTVKLEQGKSTVAERKAKAKMSDYREAMRFVSDKLGAEILKLK